MAKRSEAEIHALIAELASHGLGTLNPDESQLREMIEADRDGPLQFVNLLAYHDLARYPDDHELAGASITGAEAYNSYGMIALAHVTQRGGRLVLYNDVEQGVIGDAGRWDQVATMEYPNTAAFLDMIVDPDYLAGLVHRDAGLAETVVLMTRPLLAG
jgi:uncharacterized protein (DUF1330 family)